MARKAEGGLIGEKGNDRMKKILLLLYILMVIAISGCATTGGEGNGGSERPSGSRGSCH